MDKFSIETKIWEVSEEERGLFVSGVTRPGTMESLCVDFEVETGLRNELWGVGGFSFVYKFLVVGVFTLTVEKTHNSRRLSLKE